MVECVEINEYDSAQIKTLCEDLTKQYKKLFCINRSNMEEDDTSIPFYSKMELDSPMGIFNYILNNQLHSKFIQTQTYAIVIDKKSIDMKSEYSNIKFNMIKFLFLLNAKVIENYGFYSISDISLNGGNLVVYVRVYVKK